MATATMATAYFAVSLLLVAITFVNAVYLPNSDPKHVSQTDACPKDCICFVDKKTATCSWESSNYSLDALLPWKLQSLSLNGKSAFQYLTGNVFPTVPDVTDESLYGGVTPDIKLGGLSQLAYLVKLDIQGTPMMQISNTAFVNMPGLQELYLAENNITVIQSKTFHELHKLRILSLRDNHISSLPDGIFKDLSSLQFLDLSRNNLHEISVAMVTGLFNLEYLYLNDNRLEHVEGILHNLTSLKTLDVSSNQIHYVMNETASELSSLDQVHVSKNPLQCSCAIAGLINTVKSSPSIFGKENVTCSGPENMIGQNFNEIIMANLPCYSPEVDASPGHQDIKYQGDFVIHCSVSGSPPLGVVWVTPWGEKFAHSTTQSQLSHLIKDANEVKEYWGINVDLLSRVYVSENNSLHIDNFRGYFRGTFTCMSLNLLGSANSSVEAEIVSNIPTVYISSLYMSVICSGAMLVLGCIIGAIRLFVSKYIHTEDCNCCCCRSEDDVIITDGTYKFEEEVIEVVIPESDESDYFPDYWPPNTPFNSPMLQASPEKCSTPTEDQSEQDTWISAHIMDQLDEVRTRLRSGAVRKYEKVRSLGRSITSTISESGTVRSIKDASTIKIQSIKDTSSKTATIVRNSVASGMVQVKYGVLSIKEFCGTGEMGTGTISMISVSTDVDTKEQVTIVKSHTFV